MKENRRTGRRIKPVVRTMRIVLCLAVMYLLTSIPLSAGDRRQTGYPAAEERRTDFLETGTELPGEEAAFPGTGSSALPSNSGEESSPGGSADSGATAASAAVMPLNEEEAAERVQTVETAKTAESAKSEGTGAADPAPSTEAAEGNSSGREKEPLNPAPAGLHRTPVEDPQEDPYKALQLTSEETESPDPAAGTTKEAAETEEPPEPEDSTAPEVVISADGGKKAGSGADTAYYYNRKTWKGELIRITDQNRIRSVTVFGENVNTGAKKAWEYREDKDTQEEITVNEEKNTVRIQIDSAADLGDGRIRFTVLAEDWQGNCTRKIQCDENCCAVLLKDGSSEESYVEVRFDNKPPAAEARMKGGRLYDGIWYYRSDNCGMRICMEGGPLWAYRIRICNRDNGKVLQQELVKDPDSDRTTCTRKVPGEAEKTVKADGGENTEVLFSEKEIRMLEDGRISVTVEAEDLTGNRTRSLNDTEGMRTGRGEDGGSEGKFVLDMTCPVVTSISTNAVGKGDRAAEDGKTIPYEEGDEGNFYYYNEKTLQTVFTIEESNPRRWTLSCKRNGKASGEEDCWPQGSKPEEDADSGRQEVTFHYCRGEQEEGCSAEGRYTRICISGADKAGNPLRLQKDGDGKIVTRYTGDGESESDAAAEETDPAGEGVIRLLFGKVIDRTPPLAELTYTTDAAVWFYDGRTAAIGDPETDRENYRMGTAYVNRGFTAALQVTDCCGTAKEREKIPLDADRLSIFQYRNGKKEQEGAGGGLQDDGSYQWSFKVAEGRENSTDGSYYYKVFGTDRAGNGLCLREQIHTGKAEESRLPGLCETENCGTDCHAGFRLVLDTAAPVFDFSMTDPCGMETTAGTTSYYGSSAKQLNAFFTVGEDHLDPDRILTGYAFQPEEDSSHYDQVQLSWKNTELWTGKLARKGQSYTVALQGDREGVYRFAIQGTDKAGNPLVQSRKEKARTGFRETVRAGEGCYWSWNKVLDRTAPTGTLEIGNGNRSYYHLDLGREGSNTLAEGKNRYAPYRKERTALISITSKDRSPVRVTWGLCSTVAGKAQDHPDEDYCNDNHKSASVTGEQIFWVKDLVLVDRAGNRSGLILKNCNESNRIYLDVTPPVNKDLDGPIATITSDGTVTKSSADGRDLFNHSIDLKLRVLDPNENVRSAGLARVTYTVRADGRTVLSRTISGTQEIDGRKLHTDRAPLYGSQELDYLFEKTIHLAAGGIFETNAIEVEVTAQDNAGNQAPKVTYRCGMDTRGPEITVRYDNDHAQNGMYFNADRHAVIEVKDRNVDDRKIRIRTQGKTDSVFRNVYHGGNGGDDLWKKTISFTEDGEYTLKVEGTDALGNSAFVQFTGESPQHFIVDKTPPVIAISFNVREGYQGSRFFSSSRIGTIEIRDRNIRPADASVHIEGSLVSSVGKEKVSPEEGSWKSSGEYHTRQYRFFRDGDYTMSAVCADLAGNQAVPCEAAPFTIDTTKPLIAIVGQSVCPGELYTGRIAPRIRFEDNNYDPSAVSFYLTGLKNTVGRHLKRRDMYEDGTGFGGEVIFEDFPSLRIFDDVYTASGTITDRAGNRGELSFSFSVNRFGSTYDYNNDTVTQSFIHNCRQQGRDLYLREMNVNELISREVYLSHDADFRKLSEGEDYEVERVRNPGTSSGMIYLYRFKARCFQEEGHYEVTVQSVDAAGNKNTNAGVMGEQGRQDAVPLEFVIDRTNPTVRLRGVDPKKLFWRQNSLEIGIEPEDGVRLARVEIWLDDSLFGTWTDGEPGGNTREEGVYPLTGTLEENNGVIPFRFEGSSRPQHLHVEAVDAAGNRSTLKGEVLDWSPLVSASPLVQYYNRKKLFYSSLLAVGLLLLIPAIRKLRRDAH